MMTKKQNGQFIKKECYIPVSEIKDIKKNIKKKRTKKPVTPRSLVRSALRGVWMRSRERAFVIKRDNYTCQNCGIKQSKAKGKEVGIVVHHIDGINWDSILQYVAESLLPHPDRLLTLCEDCHNQIHGREKC